MVGAGGLGSPVAMYLAAAGVGSITLIDDDEVDLTNLQRQIIHTDDRVGEPKVESAAETLHRLNPEVAVETRAVRLDASNVLDLIDGADVIVDCGDNFPTRYLLNDASMHTGAPVVHGSVLRFEGQVSVFAPYRGPCYRCLYRCRRRPSSPSRAPRRVCSGCFPAWWARSRRPRRSSCSSASGSR